HFRLSLPKPQRTAGRSSPPRRTNGTPGMVRRRRGCFGFISPRSSPARHLPKDGRGNIWKIVVGSLKISGRGKLWKGILHSEAPRPLVLAPAARAHCARRE